MTTILNLPTPLKPCTKKDHHAGLDHLLVHYDDNAKGTAIATDGTVMVILKDLQGSGDPATKLVNRENLSTSKKGSVLHLDTDRPIIESGNTQKVGTYSNIPKIVPLDDVIPALDDTKVVHSVTIDAAKLYNIAMALSDTAKTKQVTIHFEAKNSKPIIVDGPRGIGILMPCKHDTTVQHTQNKLVDHKIAVRQAMTAYEATRVSDTLS